MKSFVPTPQARPLLPASTVIESHFLTKPWRALHLKGYGSVEHLFCALLLFCIVMVSPAPRVSAQSMSSPEANITDLKLGQAIEQELKGGEKHAYRVTLTTGQYMKVEVEQKGIDMAVWVLGPDGQKLAIVDNDPSGGTESAFVIAKASGEYRVELRAPNKEAKPGQYRIRLEELREASPNDQVLVNAARTFEEGNEFRDQKTAVSRDLAIKKFEETLPLWHSAGDKKGAAVGILKVDRKTLGRMIVRHKINLKSTHQASDISEPNS